MQSYSGCIYLTFLHYAFSNVSSNCLHENRHSHIDCICLIFLHCAFLNVASNCLPQRMKNHIGRICLAFLHCSFSNLSSNCLWMVAFVCAFQNAPSNFLGQKCKITFFSFLKIFLTLWIKMYTCMQDCISHCLHLFDFSLLCIFENPNNIRIRSFLENRIIFVFVFVPFWETE